MQRYEQVFKAKCLNIYTSSLERFSILKYPLETQQCRQSLNCRECQIILNLPVCSHQIPREIVYAIRVTKILILLQLFGIWRPSRNPATMFSNAAPEHRGPLVTMRLATKPSRVQQSTRQPRLLRASRRLAPEHSASSCKGSLFVTTRTTRSSGLMQT